MITQSEATRLIQMSKIIDRQSNINQLSFPQIGMLSTIPLISLNGNEKFLLDINRKGQIKLSKCTYQTRYRTAVVLLRLDIDGPAHPNPMVESVPLSELEPYNGQIIECPHLHIYVEGFMDKWAIPAPVDRFPDTSNLIRTFHNFCSLCNININVVSIMQWRLFI